MKWLERFDTVARALGYSRRGMPVVDQGPAFRSQATPLTAMAARAAGAATVAVLMMLGLVG